MVGRRITPGRRPSVARFSFTRPVRPGSQPGAIGWFLRIRRPAAGFAFSQTKLCAWFGIVGIGALTCFGEHSATSCFRNVKVEWRGIAMKEAKYEDLFRNELLDLHDAERQIIEALPKFAEAASNEELAAAFQQHLEETQGQLQRLEKILESTGEQPGGESCEGMRGLLQEGQKLLEELDKSEVRDAGLIAAAQKVEHYEIAGYGTARSLAEMLGQADVAELLQETLEEEKATDDLLTEIAESIMTGEALEDDSDEEMDDDLEEEEITEESAQ
jgi:ferritin-like metal-binding protein YciE